MISVLNKNKHRVSEPVDDTVDIIDEGVINATKDYDSAQLKKIFEVASLKEEEPVLVKPVHIETPITIQQNKKDKARKLRETHESLRPVNKAELAAREAELAEREAEEAERQAAIREAEEAEYLAEQAEREAEEAIAEAKNTELLNRKKVAEQRKKVAEQRKKEAIELKNEKLAVDEFNGYLLYKDKSENFSCDVVIEGASTDNAKARLIVESGNWDFIFNGTLEDDKIVVPIKKMSVLEAGTVGKIRLEVIVDDTLFVPWEDEYMVKQSKKVTVLPHSQNNEGTGISVKIKK